MAVYYFDFGSNTNGDGTFTSPYNGSDSGFRLQDGDEVRLKAVYDADLIVDTIIGSSNFAYSSTIYDRLYLSAEDVAKVSVGTYIMDSASKTIKRVTSVGADYIDFNTYLSTPWIESTGFTNKTFYIVDFTTHYPDWLTASVYRRYLYGLDTTVNFSITDGWVEDGVRVTDGTATTHWMNTRATSSNAYFYLRYANTITADLQNTVIMNNPYYGSGSSYCYWYNYNITTLNFNVKTLDMGSGSSGKFEPSTSCANLNFTTEYMRAHYGIFGNTNYNTAYYGNTEINIGSLMSYYGIYGRKFYVNADKTCNLTIGDFSCYSLNSSSLWYQSTPMTEAYGDVNIYFNGKAKVLGKYNTVLFGNETLNGTITLGPDFEYYGYTMTAPKNFVYCFSNSLYNYNTNKIIQPADNLINNSSMIIEIDTFEPRVGHNLNAGERTKSAKELNIMPIDHTIIDRTDKMIDSWSKLNYFTSSRTLLLEDTIGRKRTAIAPNNNTRAITSSTYILYGEKNTDNFNLGTDSMKFYLQSKNTNYGNYIYTVLFPTTENVEMTVFAYVKSEVGALNEFSMNVVADGNDYIGTTPLNITLSEAGWTLISHTFTPTTTGMACVNFDIDMKASVKSFYLADVGVQ